jgi:UDP-N-acetyl-D-glucosamine dehydrogenase
MTNKLSDLQRKIADRTCVIGVIGLGYVGLPLSLTFLRKGLSVIGFDLDLNKIEKINNGQSYIKHIVTDDLLSLVENGQFRATTDFTELHEPDVLFICVPTPLSKNREPDLQYIEATSHAIAKTLRAGQLIVLESTTYPGTTVEVLQPILEQGGLKAGVDFALAFSPEREDPGNKNFDTGNIPKVVGGIDQLCTDLAVQIYSAAIDQVVAVSSTQAAELTKLLENIFRSVNIALVNELKMLCHRMDIDIFEVIKAASTKPFGFMPFFPGPGLGGHCIPIDPFYLTSKAREYDFPTKFIELAGEVNTSMPYYVVHRTMEGLNQHRKCMPGAKILILGAAYKKDVDDQRESPCFKLIELFNEKGAIIQYNDPHIPKLKPARNYSFSCESVPLTQETLSSCDCVVLATDHSAYDYDFILDNAPLIIDTRGVYHKVARGNGKIVEA